MAGEMASRIGRRIREAREAKGLNQREVADLVKAGRDDMGAVDGQRISDWERGVNKPSDRYLARLAEVLDREVGWFYAAGDRTPLDLVHGGRREINERYDELLTRMAALEEQVRLLRAELAARDAEALRRNEEVLASIRRPRP